MAFVISLPLARSLALWRPRSGALAWVPALGPGGTPSRLLLTSLAALALLCGGCLRREQHSSGLVYPLQRRIPGDGLAVVNAAAGRGLHIWLDPDTETAGICRPRWNPDGARLSGGDGPTPRSGGRAPRQEFYAALRRGQVRWALRQQMQLLCRQRAPRSRFVWQEPPRSDAELLQLPQQQLPQLERQHLLSNPTAVRRSEKQLLGLPLTAADWDDRLPPRPPNGP